ncbi:hypothetical protein [Variovorax ginsengisoli]|uniref:Plastocyanin n=1 Tax=Variovorax ginsengisoli TaxID=363844 RepID=A0ABT9S309_9BURK|nr:hypothetical protein [Variovorax ginsengisoli]MDP9898309.1 plastocyanin [Variovorax ginsengisoli]
MKTLHSTLFIAAVLACASTFASSQHAGGHDHADATEDPNMVTLAAGKVDFACLQPGHYDAGMKGVVSVAKASK